ncbi:MAG: glutamate/cysteine ligase family protein, partial [Klenkia sp.]|nr:glutamate/cysteine ligase family protein [Klenkia sp.]
MATAVPSTDSTVTDARPLDGVQSAREHVVAAALHPGTPGPVGLELEAHLVDLHDPAARVPWARITGLVDRLGPLPGRSAVTLEPGGQVELSGP